MFKPRPGGDFAAAGNNLFERQNTAAENAFHRLSNLRSDSIRRKDIVSVLEPVIDRDFGGGACKSFECDKGWRDVEQRQADLVYMSSLVDLSTFPQRMYIDGGARQYSSSIGGWFLSAYPQASFDNFKIFAFEMDKLYEKTYIKGTPVKFMPYALWITDTRIPMYGSKMKSISGKHEKVWIFHPVRAFHRSAAFERWVLHACR